jgi:hypothetical protein
VLQLALTAGQRCDVGPKIGHRGCCHRASGGLATSCTVGLAMHPAGFNSAFAGLFFLFVVQSSNLFFCSLKAQVGPGLFVSGNEVLARKKQPTYLFMLTPEQ